MEISRLADRYFDVETVKIVFFRALIACANAFFFYFMN